MTQKKIIVVHSAMTDPSTVVWKPVKPPLVEIEDALSLAREILSGNKMWTLECADITAALDLVRILKRHRTPVATDRQKLIQQLVQVCGNANDYVLWELLKEHGFSNEDLEQLASTRIQRAGELNLLPIDRRPRVRVLRPAWSEVDDPYVVGHTDAALLDDDELSKRWREWCAANPNPPPTDGNLITEYFEAFLEDLERFGYFGLPVNDAAFEFCQPDEAVANVKT